MTKRKLLSANGIVAFVLLLSACGGGGGGGAPPANPPASNIATLNGLTLSAGAVAPAFQPATSNYTAGVANAIDSATVTPVATDANATVTVNGAAVASGASSAPIPFDTITTVINVVVTAEDGSTTQSYTVTVTRALATFELRDPTPGASDRFGEGVVILGNGNIVVTDPFDSSVAPNSGAVHLFNPLTQTLIASVYGDQGNDNLGSGGVTALGNSNFVIVSPNDDDGGIVDAGSVRLMNGATGAQIGLAVVGDQVVDQLGSDGITVLSNNNFVIRSQFDDNGATVDAGSVRLVDGSTGITIGTPLFGDQPSDRLGISGIVALPNNNYVVASDRDDDGPINEVGSVRLIDGTSGAQIGATLVGNQSTDQLGSGGVTALPNNNFVIVSDVDNDGLTLDAGSVRLVDGATALPIGTPLVGDQNEDMLGDRGVVGLSNSNYVVTSLLDDDGASVDVGSVFFLNGTTGAPIGLAVRGLTAVDLLDATVTVPENGSYFVLGAPAFDNGAGVDSGFVGLIAE